MKSSLRFKQATLRLDSNFGQPRLNQNLFSQGYDEESDSFESETDSKLLRDRKNPVDY